LRIFEGGNRCYTSISVNVAHREVDGIEILDLRGRLTAGTEAGTLSEAVTRLVSEGKNKLILNLKHVDFLDSSGLGMLVVCFAALQQQGGVLKLTNVGRRHMRLLVLTKLTAVVELFDNEDDAVDSFFPERATKHLEVPEYAPSSS
jgi:anti-sigma B factor antagonist